MQRTPASVTQKSRVEDCWLESGRSLSPPPTRGEIPRKKWTGRSAMEFLRLPRCPPNPALSLAALYLRRNIFTARGRVRRGWLLVITVEKFAEHPPVQGRNGRSMGISASCGCDDPKARGNGCCTRATEPALSSGRWLFLCLVIIHFSGCWLQL